MVDVEAMAAEVDAALRENRAIAPFTDRGALERDAAYRAALALRRRRETAGARVVGRKLGFTNPEIWDQFGVRAPIWGDVFDDTLIDASAGLADLPLDPRLEPRIEPELVVGFAAALAPGDDEAALWEKVAWLAPGFEIVRSPFAAWRMRGEDAVVAAGLHHALALGPKTAVDADPSAARDKVEAARATLFRDGARVEEGAPSATMGGPLAAVAHALAAARTAAEAFEVPAGAFVSTGSMTRALPAAPGEVWRVEASNGLFAPLEVRLSPKTG